MKIKKLEQRGEEFAPRTVAEAVAVEVGNSVKRLDLVLDLKVEVLESPEEDLSFTKEGPKIIVVHTKKVAAQGEPKPMLITHDKYGHITGSLPVSPLNMTVAGKDYMSYDGSSGQNIQLGDDFEFNNLIISLHWNNI